MEFKQTFRCDIQDGNKKDEIEHATLKTIAAFLNSEGGILLIEVENNRQIFGLKMDYASLGKRQDWDGFALKLDELIVDRIGTEFARYIQCEPYPLEGKEIAVVRVQKAFSLAFVLGKNKKDKDFYVRMNASTRALNVEEMYRYLTN
uniref:DNA-binding domain-containing protein n=1 Tax=Candidatus Kentrum sp. TUN TaxID=2126343 RepID=A0A451A710_9GAMM|nr:MAG: Putative DNA-binding domain-containing protein [Candidatus Kentron sp. TUN]VFK61810.1 MAG: Putative DNA-binding domain-containing protein [Candidatus Kentron sp. TUN]